MEYEWFNIFLTVNIFGKARRFREKMEVPINLGNFERNKNKFVDALRKTLDHIK